MSSMFDSEFLASLEYLALVAKRIVRGELRAERLSQVPTGKSIGTEPGMNQCDGTLHSRILQIQEVFTKLLGG